MGYQIKGWEVGTSLMHLGLDRTRSSLAKPEMKAHICPLGMLVCLYSKKKCFQLKNGWFLTGFSGGPTLSLQLRWLTISTVLIKKWPQLWGPVIAFPSNNRLKKNLIKNFPIVLQQRARQSILIWKKIQKQMFLKKSHFFRLVCFASKVKLRKNKLSSHLSKTLL